VDNDDYYSGSDSTWSPNNHKFAFYSAPVPGRLPMPKPRDLAKAVSGQAVETVDVFGRDMEKISKLKKTKKKAKKAAKKPTKKTKKK
jgi:hypothetical protein